jgi:hypothetical protein
MDSKFQSKVLAVIALILLPVKTSYQWVTPSSSHSLAYLEVQGIINKDDFVINIL